MIKQKWLIYLIGGVFLYLISTGISYAAFKALGVSSRPSSLANLPTDDQGHFVIDPSLPRTEACPLNGKLFTTLERDIWQTRRPLAVMIENHAESRPQTGLSYADIVYEAVAEGGIPRFMGVFYCGSAAYNIGFAPVRSARTYFLDWVLEYDALYNHVGGAGRCNDDTVDDRAKALCQIRTYGIKDLDQFGIPFPTCYRNPDRLGHEVATEHTMVCYSNKLYDLAAERGWTNVDEEGVVWDESFEPWKFKDEADEGNRGSVNSISFVHWDGYEAEYGVRWDYDATTNSYKRSTGGQAHTDLENGEQLMAKNVVIQFATETDGIDEHAHILYGTTGRGNALVFQDGQVISGTWRKEKRTSRTKFFDQKGNEVEFNPGQIWIEVVGTGVEVEY